MAINIKFDTAGNPEPPSIILATKNGNKLGQLNVNADSIELNDKLKISEISFTLNKYIDGKLNNLWDKVVDFKLVWCKEWDVWFEIKVELDEATETVKTVFGTQLGQAELSQIMIYNMEVNTEEDIARDDYKITILYDENNHEASLLHRIFKDKASHYSIAYVDPTIARIQRQFSWDGSSICDVLDEIEEEIGCLVVYNSNSTDGGMPNRSISVYDLEQNCNNCGHRGEFTDECPKCGSKNIKYGYGEDTTIFVTADELASDGIELVTDTDSVKNCFKLEAGDDLMTATIRNCNPNGSDYIWRFSNDIKEDMSDELVEKLESYNAEYKRYYNEYESNLDATLLTQYNNLVEKYDDFYNTDSTCLNSDCKNKGKFYDKCPSCNSENLLTGKELQNISTPIIGYPSLMNAYYNTIDFALYLQSSLMPSVEISDTTAEEQATLLTTSSLSPVAVNVKEASSISLTTADSAVLSMAKVIVKSTYKVEILSSSLSTEKKWSGTFKITNYSDDTDTVEVIVNDIVVNNDVETFIKQKIEKTLNKENTDDYSISGLFEKELVVTVVNGETVYSGEFYDELKKYALNPLQSFYDAADVCISILTEQGAGDETNKPDLYENLYLPYFQKQEAIASEISIRKNELAIIEGVYDETTKTTSGGLQNNIRNCQSVIQGALNFENYLGEKLWKEFCSFRRDDKYSNSNYISDGLNNAQLFERALEFFDVAENEIYKSSELQHSISTSLNNLLAIDKFKPLVKYFKNGNWIRVQVDDKIYKLRLLEYGINFGDFKSIPVEFSDVTKIKNSTTDVQNVLEQASSVASSYDAVTRQAKKGNVAKGTIEQWIDEGLNAANVQIQSNDSEEVLLTKNGLLARSYDDITGTYSPEQLKITHNIMAYTDDNWETVKQAIGKHGYKEYDKTNGEIVDKIGYGMSAEFVTAGVVSGSQIIGGDIYSANYCPKTVDEETGVETASGSYINLTDGTFSFAGGSLTYDGDNLSIKGAITDATSGTIGGWYITNTALYKGSDAFGNANGMYFGTNGLSLSDQFKVKPDGTAIMTKATVSGTITASDIVGSTITGGTITAGNTLYIGSQKDEDGNIIENSYSAWIDTDGVLHTNEAHINGTITAIDGMIGGFIIKATEIFEDGTKSGGWLYSGELQEGQDSVQIGDDKSIFLSATDMSGTVSNTESDCWRLTVGEHFGVTNDGTTYMSNCEITGGSLRMGTEDSGYHTWISEDGILNAQGAVISGEMHVASDSTIAGWSITENGIEKNNTLINSNDDNVYASLVTLDSDSPVRFSAGDDIDEYFTSEMVQILSESPQTVTLSCDGELYSVEITKQNVILDGWATTYSPSECYVGEINNNTFTVYWQPPSDSTDIHISRWKLEITYTYTYRKAVPAFKVLEDGSLYASAAKISGHIEANSGNIGGLKIDNGIKGRSGDEETFSLTSSGLNIPSTLAKLSIGNIEIRHNEDNVTVIQTNDALNIVGQNDTAIKLMSDNEDITTTFPISVNLRTTDNALGTPEVEIWLTTEKPLFYDKTIRVFYQTRQWSVTGYYDDTQRLVHTAQLKLSGGATKGDSVKIKSDYSGIVNDFIRFGFTNAECKNNEVEYKMQEVVDGAPNASVVVLTTSVTQTKKKNNIEFMGNILPTETIIYNLGEDNRRWNTIFLKESPNTLSDKNQKNTIQPLSDAYTQIFDSLKPVSYKFNINNSNRIHTGLIAQDVKKAVENAGLTTQDFAAYCEWTDSDKSMNCSLRYEEFIALCIDQIQKLKKRVEELENKLED